MRRSLVLLLALLAPAPLPAAPVFEKDVLPLLQARCASCHGARKRADLDVRTLPGLLRGGDGGPALTPGSAEKSLLWILVAADKMPPGKEKLTASEKSTLRTWIEGGARTTAGAPPAPADTVTPADRAFWAFRPPVRPALPAVKDPALGRNPVDAFLLAALEAKGLSYSPPAGRAALLRRITFDLTGLPPTPQEVDDFLADDSPGAYEKVVDRLLASPAYGERWGRHWLDLAGYADSEGILDADYVRSAAWRYRDYVIRAFNADKPYDRFLQEQIAGDELTNYWSAYRTQASLPAEVVEGLVATGFLRCASDTSRPDFVNIKNAPGYYYQTLDDTVKIVSSSLLGLTLQCARCHAHKFDPIPQKDYYHVQAVFMSAYRPAQWVPQVQRKRLQASEAQEKSAAQHNALIDKQVAALRSRESELTVLFANRLFEERLATLPAPIREDVRAALDAPAAKRTEVQRYLAGKFENELRPRGPAFTQTVSRAYPEFATRSAALDKQVQAELPRKTTFPEIRALYDLPGEVPTPLLRRGDYLAPGAPVSPGVPAVLTGAATFSWTPPPPGSPTSGRRLALARWLTHPDHPLTARVIVNRLWLHHFGEGLVSTPDNFGRSGAKPSHPELLDWLALELVRQGWRLKKMHRLIVTSEAYRQSSALDPERHAKARAADPDNRLLWRQRLRRLEAEALRDSVLSVAGTLSPQMYGPPVGIVRKRDGEVVAADGAGDRRSVYLQVRRSQPVTILHVFDQPVIETNCTRRRESTVSSQALAVLNSDFMVRQAEAFAERVARAEPDPARQQAFALRLAFGRSPTEREAALFAAFLRQQTACHAGSPNPARRALTDLCHMLLGANEFAYID